MKLLNVSLLSLRRVELTFASQFPRRPWACGCFLRSFVLPQCQNWDEIQSYCLIPSERVLTVFTACVLNSWWRDLPLLSCSEGMISEIAVWRPCERPSLPPAAVGHGWGCPVRKGCQAGCAGRSLHWLSCATVLLEIWLAALLWLGFCVWRAALFSGFQPPLTLGLTGYCHLKLLCFYCIALQKLKLCYLFSTVDLTLSVPGLTAHFIIPPSPCHHDMPWNGFGLKPGKG